MPMTILDIADNGGVAWNRVRTLAHRYGLTLRPVAAVPGGSQVGEQWYDGAGAIHFVPTKTTLVEIVHEIGHHIECLSNAPHAITEVNWGLERDGSRCMDGDDPEGMASDLEVGLCYLFGWPYKRLRKLRNCDMSRDEIYEFTVASMDRALQELERIARESA